MAYKHEENLKNRLQDWEFDTWEEVLQFKREFDELENVYAKARAFDDIRRIMKQIQKEFKGNLNEIHRVLGSETEYIVEDMEDK